MPSPSDPTMKAVAPPEKPTAQLPAVPAWAVDLKLGQQAHHKAVMERLEQQDTTLDRVVNETVRTNTRMTRVEERLDDLEGRIGRASTRVRESQEQDMRQDTQLAQFAVKLDEALTAANAKQTKALGELLVEKAEAAAKTPSGQRVVQAIVAVVLAALGLIAVYIAVQTQNISQRLKEAPATTQSVTK